MGRADEKDVNNENGGENQPKMKMGGKGGEGYSCIIHLNEGSSERRITSIKQRKRRDAFHPYNAWRRRCGGGRRRKSSTSMGSVRQAA